ncbi:hypothetical protein [Listeria newyorkensis]|uniref:hypothetical protein n=1 Tax=Listeria newyorkensis TaxID=1497681 RepID=UPI0010F570C3|nr:hypothetical protein [Listeria newyorkensis]
MDWKYFAEDENFNDNLVYWYEEWASISNAVKNGHIGMNIVNLRVVLADIINEYELNKFQNSSNRKIYIKLLDINIKKSSMKKYKQELQLLKESLEKKNKEKSYIIAREVLDIIKDESFSKILFKELEKILMSSNSDKKIRFRIRALTQEIIIDLITTGFDISDIERLVSSNFESYIIEKGKVIPLLDKIPAHISEDELAGYIDSLSIKDRLGRIFDMLAPEKGQYMFIFPVRGIDFRPKQGEEVRELFGVEFYNPTYTTFFEDYEYISEVFDKESISNDKIDEKKISYCNIKITVDSWSITTAKKDAKNKLFEVIDILNFMLCRDGQEIFWNEEYISVDLKNDWRSPSYELLFMNEKERTRQRSIELPYLFDVHERLEEVSEVIEKLTSRKMYHEMKTVKRVLRLLTKTQYFTNEEKLLNYWIIIESLADISKENDTTKYEFIKRAIPNIYFLDTRYAPLRYMWQLVTHYARGFFEKDDTINIPEKYLKEVGYYDSFTSKSISLDKFYTSMNELKSYIDKPSFLDHLDETIEFYSDNKVAIKRMKEAKKQVELTIDYIYKCRNQLVHNGYVDEHLIPHLVGFAGNYARSLLARVLDMYIKDNFDLQAGFIRENFEVELLEKKLKSDVSQKLIDI